MSGRLGLGAQECVRAVGVCSAGHVVGEEACTSPGVCVPTGLAVDYHNERLYWADAKLSVIGSIRLNGTDPVVAIDNKKGEWRPSPMEPRGGEGPARGRCPWDAQQMITRAGFPR